NLDRHFSDFMMTFHKYEEKTLRFTFGLLSYYTRNGHICMEIESIANRDVYEGDGQFKLPDIEDLRELIKASPVIGKPGDLAPIIKDGDRLYLHRFWYYEQMLIDKIKRRIKDNIGELDYERLRRALDLFFQRGDDKEPDWQKIAAILSLIRSFCVISGGPGTGKTTTVIKILSLLLMYYGGDLRITLSAPTGKAAARLRDAIRSIKPELKCPQDIIKAIPEDVYTIHRLLGINNNKLRFHAGNPLPYDVVVVDEASMVDVALMSKLFSALKDDAKIILLGDRNQLASVEAGAVLGDICGDEELNIFSEPIKRAVEEVTDYRLSTPTPSQHFSIRDSIVELRKNYRFKDYTNIHMISGAIKRGDYEEAINLLKSGKSWFKLPPPHDLREALRDSVVDGFRSYLNKKGDPLNALKGFEEFRILSPLRGGPYGVEHINVLVEQILKQEGLIEIQGRWYVGRPVMITTNDYNLMLFNGDIGITLRDSNGELKVFFSAQDGGIRKFLPSMLPHHETVYAMTVHKSQGSEFERALLILPDTYTDLLTRELLYTAITRVKRGVEVWALEDIFKMSILARIRRASGLKDALWV
ncbi:MAG: exodeoxyribonuclease V subunit alpha, partial [Nitrospirae bacterium]